MNYSKSTRYALHAVVEMAMASEPLSVSQIAAQYSIPEGALAKVLQRLVRVGIAHGVRGVGGGYVLAKAPSDITVLDVISVFEPPRRGTRCLLQTDHAMECDHDADCRIRRLFDEVDEMARTTFASVSIATLVQGR